MELPLIESADLNGKEVIVRGDLDASIKDGVILDDHRLISDMSTIEYLIEEGAEVILLGHVGRPNGEEVSLSTRPIANWFASQIPNSSVSESHLGNFKAFIVNENLTILENLRFYEGEIENDPDFVKKLSNLGDIYVNEAFAASHRGHASIVGLPASLPHYAGFHLVKEIKVLKRIIDAPTRPLTSIIGGAKIETKLPLVERMAQIADYVLVGGEIASYKDRLSGIRGRAKVIVGDTNVEKTDILDDSIAQFVGIIHQSMMVVWNGPLGKVDEEETLPSEKGSMEIAKAIIESGCYSLVGGGDTGRFLQKVGLRDKFSFMSTGGGAMLEFLSGKKLPGIEALLINHKS
jgi:phosphoglycerate kinase